MDLGCALSDTDVKLVVAFNRHHGQASRSLSSMIRLAVFQEKTITKAMDEWDALQEQKESEMDIDCSLNGEQEVEVEPPREHRDSCGWTASESAVLEILLERAMMELNIEEAEEQAGRLSMGDVEKERSKDRVQDGETVDVRDFERLAIEDRMAGKASEAEDVGEAEEEESGVE